MGLAALIPLTGSTQSKARSCIDPIDHAVTRILQSFRLVVVAQRNSTGKIHHRVDANYEASQVFFHFAVTVSTHIDIVQTTGAGRIGALDHSRVWS